MEDGTTTTHRELNLVPDRYPFVVLRHEYFGGYLFNRFLSYTELDRLQTRVLELSEGHLSLNDIIGIIAQEYDIPVQAARTHVESAFDLFDSNCAIYWRTTRKSGDYTVPAARAAANKMGRIPLSAPLYVLWDITYACNLRCEHCLTDSGKQAMEPMSFERVCQIIDQLVEFGVFFINFVGGEPFVRRDMLDILAYASQKPIGLSVTTNGLLVDEKLLESLSTLNIFDMQISIDGLRETHDAFRGLPGTFDRASRAVKQLSDAGFRTTINTVMTQRNCAEMEELIETSLDLGATTFKAVAFLPVGRGKLNYEHLLLTPQQLRDNALLLRELGAKYDGEIKILTEENYPLTDEHEPRCSTATCFPTMGCAAGISQLVIDPTGKVFACPFLHDLLAGDLGEQSMADIWETSAVLDTFRNIDRDKLKGSCHDCQYAPAECRGGCRAAAYAVTGDLWAEDPLCWHANS